MPTTFLFGTRQKHSEGTMHSGAIVALPTVVVEKTEKAEVALRALCRVTDETVELEKALTAALGELEAETHSERLADRLQATSELLTDLSERHIRRGETAKAEVLYLRAIQVFCAVLPADHPLIALSRDNLAGLYKARRQYVLAESLQRMALANLRRHYKGQPHIDVAVTMCNLADTCMSTGRVQDARALVEEGVAMMRKLFGPDDARVRELLAHYETNLQRVRGK